MPENTETRSVTVSTSAGIPAGTVLDTPEGMPNVVVRTKSPLRRTVVRIARIYVTTFAGMLTIVFGNVAPDYLRPPEELWAKIVLAGGFALSPSFVALVSNLAEWLLREDAQ